MEKCDKINLLKLQGQYLRFIVENHAELNILEHIERCEECRRQIKEAVEKDLPLSNYGNLFQREFDDESPVNFIDSRIQWRKRKLKELLKNAEMELIDLETRL